MNATRSSKVTVEIRKHSRYPETHQIGIITTARGYCYSCTWARDDQDAPLTEAEVLQAWREDRRAFLPYRSY